MSPSRFNSQLWKESGFELLRAWHNQCNFRLTEFDEQDANDNYSEERLWLYRESDPYTLLRIIYIRRTFQNSRTHQYVLLDEAHGGRGAFSQGWFTSHSRAWKGLRHHIEMVYGPRTHG